MTISKLARWLVVLALLVAGVTAQAQTAGRRVALVIGNGAYERPGSALRNPANDARAMAEKLRALGFEVIDAIDRDHLGMRRALGAFDRAMQGASAGLFYYAGHGMEYRGRNYLFPVDATLETEGDVGLNLIDLDQVLQVMETAVPTRLLFLDACRDNPLARRFRSALGATRSSSIGQGLARVDAGVGTFIAYATAPGDVAADGTGSNSPFTAAMLTHLDEPGLEVGQLMRKVRNSVLEATNERQVPWESSSLRGAPFILNLSLPPEPSPAAPAMDDRQAEIVYWQSIKDSRDQASFKAYLARFGDTGLFSELAKLRIDALQAGAEVAALPPAAPQEAEPAEPARPDPRAMAPDISGAYRLIDGATRFNDGSMMENSMGKIVVERLDDQRYLVYEAKGYKGHSVVGSHYIISDIDGQLVDASTGKTITIKDGLLHMEMVYVNGTSRTEWRKAGDDERKNRHLEQEINVQRQNYSKQKADKAGR